MSPTVSKSTPATVQVKSDSATKCDVNSALSVLHTGKIISAS